MLVLNDALAREGLRRILQDAGDMQVVGEATDASEAMEKAGQCEPDVIVAGLSAPDVEAFAAAKRRHRLIAETRIIMLVTPSHSLDSGRLLRTGALGYVATSSARAELIEAVRTVLDGRRYVCSYLRHALEQAPGTGHDAPDPIDHLTRREREVVQLLAVGRTTQEVAAALDLRPKTVSAHRARILAKLGLRNNVELAHFAIVHNLVRP